MTGEFRFEDRWMSPWYRIKDPHVTLTEQWIPPAPWLVEESQERVVDSNQPLAFQFHWSDEGPLKLVIPNPNNLRWECKVMVEGMGNIAIETEAAMGQALFVGVGPHTYLHAVNIAPPPGGWPIGVYEIVATLQLVVLDGAGNIFHRLPVVGFAELGKLQVYGSP